jgi:hypothetical protein
MSVSPVGLSAFARWNSLSLFKTASEPPANLIAPMVEADVRSHISIIANLAAKLIDLKTGGDGIDSSRATLRPGDGLRELTTPEKAAEKANIEAYYQEQDDAHLATFSQDVVDALLNNDLYKNDPSFQAALKSGTLSVERGDIHGLQNSTRTILFNDQGYSAGVKSSGFEVSKDIWTKIENVDGHFISKADGKNVAIGLMNELSFWVTWPREG